MISELNHINIDTPDLDATVEFYEQVLGLVPRAKPSGNSGMWMYLGDAAVVHINVVPESLGTVTGNFNHVAFSAANLDRFVATLTRRGTPHRVVERPDMGLTQLLFNDPNGIAIELSFDTVG